MGTSREGTRRPFSRRVFLRSFTLGSRSGNQSKAAAGKYRRVDRTDETAADAATEAEVIRAGALEIRPAEGLASARGQVLSLSVREFGVLSEMARSEGRIVRREELYERIWGTPLRPGDRTIDVYVRRLRVKLSAALPGCSFIHTHVGFGYRFAPEGEASVANGAGPA